MFLHQMLAPPADDGLDDGRVFQDCWRLYTGCHHWQACGAAASLGRTEATGFGVVYCIREAMKHLGIDPSKLRLQSRALGMWDNTLRLVL